MVADMLIRAKNLQYGFDSRPAFRDWPVERDRTGEFANMEKIAHGTARRQTRPVGPDAGA